MKKILTKFLPLLLLISLISCNQLVVGIEKTFSYWANGATIIGIELPPNTPVDGDGFSSLPSGQNARICFKLNNPQKFEFLMPGDSNAPADIIVFDGNVRGKNEGRPELGEGKDYSLIQKSSDTLELTYTKEFLLKNEQGKANLNPKIKLYNKKDNRRFVQNYNYKLRANTVPPKPEWVTTGKIKDGENWYYVLIFKFEGLTNSIDTGNLLHGDISEVYLTEGESQKAPIQVKLTNNGFDVSHSQGNLVPANIPINALVAADLTGGSLTGLSAIPNANDRKWMLCIKTGVKTGDSLSYEVKVKDLRGLPSEETSGVTNVAKLPIPQISYDSGMAALTSSGVYTDNETALNNHSSSSTNPILISSCFGKTVVLKAYNDGSLSGVTIHAEVKLSASAPAGHSGGIGSIQQDGNITKIFLDPIPEVDEIYEVKLKAKKPGYTDSDEKTYYYQIKKEVRADTGSNTSSWQILKNAVAGASAGDTIYIKGHIKSTNAPNNSGEIEVSKNINIKGSTGKINDIIDANRIGPDNPSPTHRIFNIKNGGSLNLTGLTLQDGKAYTGGAILAEIGSVLTLKNTDIKYSEATNGGGAISTGGTLIINGGSVISGNEAPLGGAIYNGGILKISGDAKIVPSAAPDENALGKNDVYLPMGKVITVTGELSEDSVARISPVIPYTAGRQVVKGDGYILNNGDISKFSLTQKPGETWSLQRDSTLNALVLKKEATEITTWKGLQDAVDAAQSGDTITVKNTLIAGTTTSEISITKNLTIKGEGTSAVLDANEKHRIFNVSNGASLKLKDITLKKGEGTKGAGVHVTGGSLELENVTITECKNSASLGEGGAIYISNSSNGRLWIKGSSKILSNGAEKGAGIYIDTNLGENIIEGSTEISGNTCQSSGQGGGIYLYKGKLVLKDNAKILNNESMVGAAGGGGVYISEHGTLTIKDSCIIQGNKAKNSGGTTITGNGGGIYNSGKLIMKGGEIKENEAKFGGAVYNNGTFEISGSAKIELSEGPDENKLGKNDIYLPADKVITVTGSLTEDSVARISPVTPYTADRQVVEAASGVTLADKVSKFKVTDGKKWKINTDGKLEEDNQGKTVTSWAELKTEVEKPSGGAEVIIVDGTETNLTATAFTDEINVNRNVTIIGKNSNITLNANEKCRIFKIDGNALLKLDNIKLTKGKVTSNGGGAIKILEGECIITNTVISNCKAKDGGAIDIDLRSGGDKAHCTLKTGTKIEFCGATFTGGGVRISSGTTKVLLTMEMGSSISSCTADTNGGAVWSKATFNMTGGSIEGNTAGKPTANGSTQGSGGGVFNGQGGIFNMSGGKIIKNKAIVANSNPNDSSGNGGGVCIHRSNFTMTGGIIGGNENGEANIATKRGGGVFHNGNKFELSGSAKITPSANTDEHTHGKNDVYLSNNKTIKITKTLDAGQNQAARITVHKTKYNESTQVLDGSTAENANKFKVTKKGTQNWYVDNDGKLKELP